MIVLPLVSGNCQIAVTAELVAEIEAVHGSLYGVAERLIDRSLTVTAMLDILKIAYQYGGQAVDDGFLLQQDCTEILSALLMGVLQPMERTRQLPPSQMMDDVLRQEREG